MKSPAHKLCCSFAGLILHGAIISVCDWFPIFHLGIFGISCIGWLCTMKRLLLADVSSNVSSCRSWNLFVCLFLRFTRAVSCLWAVLLKVHFALWIVCLRLFRNSLHLFWRISQQLAPICCNWSMVNNQLVHNFYSQQSRKTFPLPFWTHGSICGWPRPVSSRSVKQPGLRSSPIVTL